MTRILGGYLLMERAQRDEPPPLSASSCLCTQHPRELDLALPVEGPAADGEIAAADASAHALMANGTLLWPDVFADLDAARAFARRHLAAVPDLHLLRISIAGDRAATFVREAVETAPPEFGLQACVALGRTLDREPAAAEVLGFEVLGFDYGTVHSHHCNGLATDYLTELGIPANAHGLIDREADAARAAAWTRRDEVGAEPCPWTPWLVERMDG